MRNLTGLAQLVLSLLVPFKNNLNGNSTCGITKETGCGIILSVYEIKAGLPERREYKRSGNIREAGI